MKYTILLLRSRPNQSNSSAMVINEVDQTDFVKSGTSYHNSSKSIFSIIYIPFNNSNFF